MRFFSFLIPTVHYGVVRARNKHEKNTLARKIDRATRIHLFRRLLLRNDAHISRNYKHSTSWSYRWSNIWCSSISISFNIFPKANDAFLLQPSHLPLSRFLVAFNIGNTGKWNYFLFIQNKSYRYSHNISTIIELLMFVIKS